MNVDDYIGLLETLDGLRELTDFLKGEVLTHHERCVIRAMHILTAQHGMKQAVEKETGRHYAVVGSVDGGSPVVLTITGDPLILLDRADFEARFDTVANELNDRIANFIQNQAGFVSCLMAIAQRLDVINPPDPADYAIDRITNTVATIINRVQTLIEEKHRFAAMAGAAQSELNMLKQRIGVPIVTTTFVPCLGCADGMACAMAKGCRLGNPVEAEPPVEVEDDNDAGEG